MSNSLPHLFHAEQPLPAGPFTDAHADLLDLFGRWEALADADIAGADGVQENLASSVSVNPASRRASRLNGPFGTGAL